MYTVTSPTLLTTIASDGLIDQRLHELRYLEDCALLVEKRGPIKNVLQDAGQAALSTGAIAATGGAGGDVIVDLIFAAEIAKDTVEEVTSLIKGAGELGDIIIQAAKLDFDASEAFEKQVQSLIAKTVQNRFVGDKAKEMMVQAAEKIHEVLEKIARAVGKWVGTLIPDDFGLGGPAFEALFEVALKKAGSNAYSIAVAGINALPFDAGKYLIDREALENLLETIATKMIEFIDDVTEWAAGQRADLEDENFGDKVIRKALGVKDQAAAAGRAYVSSQAKEMAKLGKIAVSPYVAMYAFANNLTDGRLEATADEQRAELVNRLKSKGVDDKIVSAVDKFYATSGTPLKLNQAMEQFDEDQQQKVKDALSDYADAWKNTNKGEITYMADKVLPKVREILDQFRNEWIPTAVAVLRKLMSWMMAGLVVFQELVDPKNVKKYLRMKTKKGSDWESLNPLAGQKLDIEFTEDELGLFESTTRRNNMALSQGDEVKMKVTKGQLRKLIKEQTARVLAEQGMLPDGDRALTKYANRPAMNQALASLETTYMSIVAEATDQGVPKAEAEDLAASALLELVRFALEEKGHDYDMQRL